MGRDDLVASAAYQPGPTAAAAARRFVRDTLQEWTVGGAATDGHGLVDDAVLLTSELVTNAVVHAGTAVQVTCRLGEGGVQVMVSDGHPSRLVPEPPAGGWVPAEHTSGRGLLLPTALASAWGVTYGQSAKAVWFRLALVSPAGDVGAGAAWPRSGDGAPEGGAEVPAGGTGAGTDGTGAGTDGAAALAAMLGWAPGPGGDTAALPDAHGRGPALAGDPGYQGLLATTVESARAATGADAAYALMADEDGDLRLRAVAGTLPSGMLAPEDDAGPAGEPHGPRMPGAQSAREQERAEGEALPPGVTAPSVVTVPFVVDGRVAGLLAVLSAAGHGFSRDESRQVQRLADRWGPPLERARLRELARVRRGRIAALAETRGLLSGRHSPAEVMALAGQAAVPRIVPWCAVLTREGVTLRTAYARHADQSRSGALAWLLDRVCDEPAPEFPPPGLPGVPGPAWRRSLAVPSLAGAPDGAGELTADTAWCFPLGPGARPGLFVVGHPPRERVPREAAELAADLACRVGLALAGAPVAGLQD